jgi:hypothetical protein
MLLMVVCLIALTGVVGCIASCRRAPNHQANERMEISENEELDVPPVLPPQAMGQVPHHQPAMQYVYVMPPPNPYFVGPPQPTA